MKDVFIIGNGPAGLSAAIYCLRAGLETAIIGKDDGALTKAEKIENYFGVLGSPSGSEILNLGKEQVSSLGATIIKDEVLSITSDGNFKIICKDAEYESRAVILAAGAARKTADIPGLSLLEGKGISYCAVCDGFFYRNKDVAVLGSSQYALHEANELLPVAKSVTLLTNGAEITAKFPDNINIITERISEIYGNPVLSGVKFDSGNTLSVSGLFVALGSAGAVDLARALGAAISGSAINVDDNMATTVPGFFAAGDCTGGIFQVSIAVGEGAKAARSAITYVRNLSKESSDSK